MRRRRVHCGEGRRAPAFGHRPHCRLHTNPGAHLGVAQLPAAARGLRERRLRESERCLHGLARRGGEAAERLQHRRRQQPRRPRPALGGRAAAAATCGGAGRGADQGHVRARPARRCWPCRVSGWPVRAAAARGRSHACQLRLHGDGRADARGDGQRLRGLLGHAAGPKSSWRSSRCDHGRRRPGAHSGGGCPPARRRGACGRHRPLALPGGAQRRPRLRFGALGAEAAAHDAVPDEPAGASSGGACPASGGGPHDLRRAPALPRGDQLAPKGEQQPAGGGHRQPRAGAEAPPQQRRAGPAAAGRPRRRRGGRGAGGACCGGRVHNGARGRPAASDTLAAEQLTCATILQGARAAAAGRHGPGGHAGPAEHGHLHTLHAGSGPGPLCLGAGAGSPGARELAAAAACGPDPQAQRWRQLGLGSGKRRRSRGPLRSGHWRRQQRHGGLCDAICQRPEPRRSTMATEVRASLPGCSGGGLVDDGHPDRAAC
mmetsp:Transcript_55609/g.172308  ORF Transcript_55609/g.172308 Transcript_55609/m.172308 type:complete len:488 (+) Transcript_55609:346-1809(+)